jgi:hypothetical protein
MAESNFGEKSNMQWYFFSLLIVMTKDDFATFPHQLRPIFTILEIEIYPNFPLFQLRSLFNNKFYLCGAKPISLS